MYVNTKRLKVTHVPNDSERDEKRGEELAETSDDIGGLEILGNWFPDETWFNIYSFMYARELNVITRGAGILHLFRNLAYVSKDFYLSLIRYVRYAPQELFGCFKATTYGAIAWVCKHKLKLREFTISSGGTKLFAFIKYILTSCDITKLEECLLPGLAAMGSHRHKSPLVSFFYNYHQITEY